MKAYLLTKYGPASSLNIQDTPEPLPKAGEVRVKVQRIGINYAEILSRRGQYRWAPKLPYVLGMEAYGAIDAIGEGVDRQIGEKVIAGGQFGSYAEKMIVKDYMALPALEQFSPEENAAFIVNYMTAWVGLMKLARLQSSDSVLVNAAAGGVGTAAVQLAKALGCKVFGTASQPEKLRLLKELGVDHPINYRELDFASVVREAQSGGGVDVVLELVGGETFRKSRDLLNPFGKIIIAGMAGLKWSKRNPLTWPELIRNIPRANIIQMAQRSTGLLATHIGYLIEHREVVEQEWLTLTQYVTEHDIKPLVSQVFPFEKLPQAHEYIESRKSYGKVVVSLD
ncbi:MAG: zinc-binding dehydrogenase [Bacteroidota bacterium]